MATRKKAATAAEQEQAAPESFDITLDEYCQDKSGELKQRVELVSAFNVVESAAGRIKASRETFDKRFNAFTQQPAK